MTQEQTLDYPGRIAFGALDHASSQPSTQVADAPPLFDVSIVMPCLNEEEGVGICVEKARGWLTRSGLSGEVIVVDNGSTDRSIEIAEGAGARVIREARRGYGRAYLTGLASTRSRWIVMGDADDTYDFSDLDALVAPLHGDIDLVIANRFQGGIAPGAMPWSHRYIGTPAINRIMAMFTGARVSDSQSGFRAFTREAYLRMGLTCDGMEFASEMVVRSARRGLRITEVPMPYLPRQGESKLRTFRDGWRHLRYLLLATPDVLFIAPAVACLVLGVLTAILAFSSPSGVDIGSLNWQPVFASTIFLVVGTNALALGLLSKREAVRRGIVAPDGLTAAFERHFRLEAVLVLAGALIAVGLVLDLALLVAWLQDERLPRTLQLAGLAQSLLIVGANVALAGFLAVMVEPVESSAPGQRMRSPVEPEAGSGRLRIALVYDALFPYQKGGAERRFHEFANRLSERHDVHHVTWDLVDGPSVVQRDGVTLHGVGKPPALYGEDGKRTIREALSFAARLGPVLARERFDVIDCSATPYLPLYSAFPAARARRTPMIATWHEYWGPHWGDYLPHRRAVAHAARASEWLSVRMADGIVAVSQFTAERLAPRLKGKRAPVVVENGISYRALAEAAPVGAPVDVAFVGRLIEDKRVEVLIEAIAALRASHPDITCEIVGDGPERARLEALAASLALEGSVRFLGFVDEATLLGRLKRARVFALPSVREGFGIAVVEAQACGAVPIVARAPHSAAPHLVERGLTGLVCDPNADDFASGIAYLLGNAGRLETMSRASVTAAAARDWDCVTSQMEQVYRSLAHGKQPSRSAEGSTWPA